MRDRREERSMADLNAFDDAVARVERIGTAAGVALEVIDARRRIAEGTESHGAYAFFSGD
jgi:hypothetical protein